ncbi:MAG: cell wall-binding repeat-containing protein [Clostridia bacterium]|nr:cell wall-binding repeat-containing protein [Clostridia bacterium]
MIISLMPSMAFADDDYDLVTEVVTYGVVFPTDGEHPVTISDLSVPPGNGYALDSAKWYDVSGDVGWQPIGASDTFVAENMYVLELIYSPAPGYQFASPGSVWISIGDELDRAAEIVDVYIESDSVRAQYYFTAAEGPKTYELYIAGTQVTENNLSGDGWSFEPESNTLYLDGFVIEGDYESSDSEPAIYAKGFDLTVIGTCTISGKYGIEVDYGGLAIRGDDTAELSTTNITINGAFNHGIFVDGDLNIVNSKLTAAPVGDSGLYASGNITITGSEVETMAYCGIYTDEDLEIISSKVTIPESETGIYVDGDITIKGSELDVSGFDYAIYSEDSSVDISKSKINILDFGEYGIRACNYLSISDNSTVTVQDSQDYGGMATCAGYGEISIKDSELTAYNCVECGIYASEDYDGDGVSVSIDNSKVTVAGGEVPVYAQTGDLVISGSTVTVTDAYYGILVPDGDLTIDDSVVTAKSVGEEGIGICSSTGSLSISGPESVVEAEGGDCAIYAEGGIEINDVEIIKPEGGELSSDGTIIVDADGSDAKYALIKTKTYTLTIVKQWEDNGDAAGKRPDSIDVKVKMIVEPEFDEIFEVPPHALVVIGRVSSFAIETDAETGDKTVVIGEMYTDFIEKAGEEYAKKYRSTLESVLTVESVLEMMGICDAAHEEDRTVYVNIGANIDINGYIYPVWLSTGYDNGGELFYLPSVCAEGSRTVELDKEGWTVDGNKWTYELVMPGTTKSAEVWETSVPEGYEISGKGTEEDPIKLDISGDVTTTLTNEIRTFTITFVNWDGTVLQTGKTAYGAIPAYTGATPTKPNDDKYAYTFTGWTPEITAVTGDATYTATFKAEEIPSPPPASEKEIIRLAGPNRYDTALAAAEHLREKSATGKFKDVIIASGKDFPDALSATYLAYVKGAPILLVGNADSITKVTKYINENQVEGGTVYIIGGTGAVPAEVDGKLTGTVKRLAGANRYATNIEVLKEAGIEGKEILIASGKGYADALSASAAGRPILLVGNALTADQKTYLADNKVNLSGKTYIVGGTGAVSDAVEKDLKNYFTGDMVRFAGKNRYETSEMVAKEFFKGIVNTMVIASGKAFPDGLSGGPVATTYGAPLLLVTDGVTDHAKSIFVDKGMYRLMVMGGTGAVSKAIAEDIAAPATEAE